MSFLSKQKQSLLNSCSRLALYIGLGFGLHSVPAFAQSAPTPVKPDACVETVAPKTDISGLRREFARTALGREMLDFADKNQINITVEDSLGSWGSYNAVTNNLRLQQGMNLTDNLITLAHELRHAWQDVNIDYYAIDNTFIDPEQSWLMNRLIEADAFAFSAYFMAVRKYELPSEKHESVASESEMKIAEYLLAEMHTSDGLTLAEYREGALEYFLGDLYGYNADHLIGSTSMPYEFERKVIIAQTQLNMGIGIVNTSSALNSLENMLDATPDEATFEMLVRKMGGISMDPAETTSLMDPDVTYNKLFDDYPFRSVSAVGGVLTVTEKDDAGEEHALDICEEFNKAREKTKNAETRTREMLKERKPALIKISPR